MADDLDWLFRPVDRGYYRGESLYLAGAIDLAFVAMCNEACDVADENQYRWEQANT